jgi:hypothetical protein
MENDFPAAHSMDAVWFAVDDEGHIGRFFSSESGAVPLQAADVSGRQQEQLVQMLPRGQAVEDLKGRLIADKGKPSHCSYALPDDPLLMFVNSADGLRSEIEAGRATQVQALDGLAFILLGTSREEYDRLHAAGVCRGCFWGTLPNSQEPSPAEVGLFSFQHAGSNDLSYPYVRQSVPAKPLHVDQLPPQLRKAVKRVVLPLRFTDTLRIQPVELVPCESSESVYLDSTGTKLRPIPGKELEYAEQFADMAETYRGEYEIEPPLGNPVHPAEEAVSEDGDE